MFEEILKTIYEVVWSPFLVVLLVGAGMYFSVRTRFVQIRRLGLIARLVFSKEKSGKKGVISPFQALCLSISGCVGTGNIVGVATAIAFGGPGSIFWMWIIAILGASTSFVECTLAQKYHLKHGDTFLGGPAIYIERALGLKWLGMVFAGLIVLGYGLCLPMVQVNGVASAYSNAFHISPAIVGGVLAFLLMLVVSGGAKRIAKVAGLVTPFMACFYVLLAMIVLLANAKALPGVFVMIFESAFGIRQIGGGILGIMIITGIKRGLFSNEAGVGGSAIASAGANAKAPAVQGLVQSFSVYVDTILICTMTALMILSTGMFNIFDSVTGEMIYVGNPDLGANYVGYTQAAINTVFPGFGGFFVALALSFFVFTTLIAYCYYAETSLIYILRVIKKNSERLEKILVTVYKIGLLTLIIVGACIEANEVWTIGDIGIGITTWLNVTVLVILCPQAVKELREYELSRKKDGK